MEKRSRWNAELIVAGLAVAIGVCTMFVYIYQAKIMSKQMHAAAWPYLEMVFSNSGSQFAITVHNKGVGPAIIKNAAVIVDKVRYHDSQKNIDSIIFQLTGKRRLLNGYSNINNRVVAPGEAIDFIEVTDSVSVKILLQSLAKHSVQLEVCYCSVFDECWTAVNAKVVSCEKCETNE